MKISDQEFIEFIFSQPRERKIDMDEPKFDSDCGCLMVQYGREKGLKFHSAGIYNLLEFGGKPVGTLQRNIFTFVNGDATNYGQVQDYLRTQEFAQPFCPAV